MGKMPWRPDAEGPRPGVPSRAGRAPTTAWSGARNEPDRCGLAAEGFNTPEETKAPSQPAPDRVLGCHVAEALRGVPDWDAFWAVRRRHAAARDSHRTTGRT